MNSSKESIDIYNLISSEEMIISEPLKGVMYEACRSAGIEAAFFDAHAEVQATMQKCRH